jgi:hypothetical protein
MPKYLSYKIESNDDKYLEIVRECVFINRLACCALWCRAYTIRLASVIATGQPDTRGKKINHPARGARGTGGAWGRRGAARPGTPPSHRPRRYDAAFRVSRLVSFCKSVHDSCKSVVMAA